MRRMKRGAGLVVLIVLTIYSRSLPAQTQEVQQLLLNVEKLAQFKQILADMKNGYQIISTGYQTVKNISEGNFSLHQVFLDGLLQISPVVRNYRKVPDIISMQIQLISEYKKAFGNFKEAGYFSQEELKYLKAVYNNLFNKSLRNLDELVNVVTAGKLRMSDDERLQEIDRIDAEMADKLTFLHHFNGKASVYALSKKQESAEIKHQQLIYGLQP